MRTLEQLQKQYNSSSKHGGPKGGPGFGPRGRGMGMKGKPKNLKKTIVRLLSYVGEYKFRLVAVLLCMLCTTCFSLVGGYMIAPIVTRISKYLAPDKVVEMSAMERAADAIIEKFSK